MSVHIPVFPKEVLEYLSVRPGEKYIDATADGGGHAMEILRAFQPDGRLLAIEWDPELFELLRARLKKECPAYSKNYVLRQESFRHIARLSREAGFAPARGILFDLGVSSFHLEASKRGFSFQKDEILDMRFNPRSGTSAAELLERVSKEELAGILKNFGGERYSSAIAESIVRVRKRRSIKTTAGLVRAIAGGIPGAYRRKSGIHFATRSFQALRIAVNREFEAIQEGLSAAWNVLAPEGRVVVISFHSGEDGLVKRFFRSEAVKQSARVLTPKPVQPSFEEIALNPRARSARLRAYEKIAA